MSIQKSDLDSTECERRWIESVETCKKRKCDGNANIDKWEETQLPWKKRSRKEKETGCETHLLVHVTISGPKFKMYKKNYLWNNL